jgi:hypothetical protein
MVTVRNISYMYTEQMLLEEFRDGGFGLQRDFAFFCMPVGPAGVHLGYCLVGFRGSAIRNQFFAAFQDRPLRDAGPTAPPLKIQATSSRELEPLARLGIGTPSAAKSKLQQVKQKQQQMMPVPAKAPRTNEFCPFCGNHASCCRNPFHRYNV